MLLLKHAPLHLRVKHCELIDKNNTEGIWNVKNSLPTLLLHMKILTHMLKMIDCLRLFQNNMFIYILLLVLY